MRGWFREQDGGLSPWRPVVPNQLRWHKHQFARTLLPGIEPIETATDKPFDILTKHNRFDRQAGGERVPIETCDPDATEQFRPVAP